jgi:hypothetical protein
LQGLYRSDGTRTRDLRRDRPVLAGRRLSGIGGIHPKSRAFRSWDCGIFQMCRQLPDGLRRDVGGMRSTNRARKHLENAYEKLGVRTRGGGRCPAAANVTGSDAKARGANVNFSAVTAARAMLRRR